MTRQLILQVARPTLQRSLSRLPSRRCLLQHRGVSTQNVQRRDNFWIPTVSLKTKDGPLDATQLLTRAGYLRQAYSGIYHMLPLGLRVQDKLERLIDKHMSSIDASKVSLSSISSQSLWQKSGRLSVGSELFKFTDRRDTQWLLAPTHEEEITSLVADVVHSPNQLPIRLYQITRKYRDEKRPRGGLLRGREFIMKDLYTFDIDLSTAHTTYDGVRQAYRNFLDELKIEYIEARADSGNMGGNLSHEYHFPSKAGEDNVITCDNCNYARNEEWVPKCSYLVRDVPPQEQLAEAAQIQNPLELTASEIIGKPQTCLIKAFAPVKKAGREPIGINAYAVKAALNSIVEIDTGVEEVRHTFAEAISHPSSPDKGTVYYLFDPSITSEEAYAQIHRDMNWLNGNDLDAKMVMTAPGNIKNSSLLKQISGDSCPQCQKGVLEVNKAIEIAHTFHLGKRYSSRLDLKIRSSEKDSEPIPVEMGCHGIGVSRLVAAVASSLSDEVGLNWPRVIAPFEAVLVVDGKDSEKSKVAAEVYDVLTNASETGVDTLLDDRTNVSNGYKLKDADLIGYPIILIVGKTWQSSGEIEIQCRRLQVKESTPIEGVAKRVGELLAQL